MGPGQDNVKVNKVLMGPFGLTHLDRISAFKLFSTENGSVDIVSKRTAPRAFAQTMRSYKFVAAIRGNGVDTHRLWESMYRGAFPIIKHDQWSQSVTKYELPLQIVQDWTLDEMERILATSPSQFVPSDIESLWWPYWRKLIDSYV
jgi:hypothetical protein